MKPLHHHRNAIFYLEMLLACHTDQLVLQELDIGFTSRAGQDFKQIFGKHYTCEKSLLFKANAKKQNPYKACREADALEATRIYQYNYYLQLRLHKKPGQGNA